MKEFYKWWKDNQGVVDDIYENTFIKRNVKVSYRVAMMEAASLIRFASELPCAYINIDPVAIIRHIGKKHTVNSAQYIAIAHVFSIYNRHKGREQMKKIKDGIKTLEKLELIKHNKQ